MKPKIHTEIEDIISSFKSSKSTGLIIVPVNLLKHLIPYISRLLAIIFNESMTLGNFPEELKCAKVIPIDKNGSSTDPSNYRPISLLFIYSKILEKIMDKRLYEFIDKMDVFYSSQFGFREKHFTNYSLISMTETIWITSYN